MLAVEAKCFRELQERQNVLEDGALELILTVLALSLYNLYGWDYDKLMEAINECNRQFVRFYSGETLETIQEDLKSKTGIEFFMTRHGGEEFCAIRKD